MKIPTMLIEIKGAPCVINQSDFNPKVHKKWKEGKKVPAAPKASAPIEAIAVHKGGGKWVVMVDGAQLNKGWLTKAEAKALAAEQ